MGKVKSILQIEGSVGDFVYYTMKGVRYVRQKDLQLGERVKHDPNFEAFRKNSSEFGHCSRMGKKLRDSLAPLVAKSKDYQLVSRMQSVLAAVKNLDAVSEKGQRNLHEGLKTAEGKALLQGFNFNANAPLQKILRAKWLLDPATGTFQIPDFSSQWQLVFPKNGTHAHFLLAAIRMDFDTGDTAVTYSLPVTIPKQPSPILFSLTPETIPDGNGNLIYVLAMSFSQLVNGTYYPLGEEKGNVLHVLEVV